MNTDKQNELVKGLVEGVKRLSEAFVNSLYKFSSLKTLHIPSKQYGISLMKERNSESKWCKSHRIERKIRKHLPYQRRNY